MRRRRATHRTASRPAARPIARPTGPLLFAALRAAMAGLVVALLVAPPAMAGPKGGKVSKGRVKISQKGHKTRIKASHGAIIDWDSFDIGQGEKVRFVQPGKKARVMNRVDDSAPTRIDGTLKANGQVYIVNSAGVYFGGHAVVDVGRLVAAAGRLGDDDFARGNDRFRQVSGRVENAGRIEADAIALVGRSVANHGRLAARDGDVAVLAGDTVWIGHPESDVRIKVGEVGDLEGPAVENTGHIVARRGRARLAAGDGLALALRESSRARADQIHVEADDVAVSGKLDASDAREGRTGGDIVVLGDTIRTLGAEIDASGDSGGGQIRIGGGFQGGEGLRAAQVTALDTETRVRADALREGDGGAAVVWSDNYSLVGAEMSARGGSEGGDGGLVETSAKQTLQVLQAADVSAAEGKAGTWLLDPSNVRIVEVSDPNADDTDTGSGEISLDDSTGSRLPILALFQSDGPPATVSASSLVEALEQGTSVLVTTDTFNAVGDDVGNISVEAPILIENPIADGGSLVMLAANDIVVQEDIGVVEDAPYALNLFLVANDNELGAISQSVNELRADAAEASGGLLRVPSVQPELGQTAPAADGGLVGNRQAELGNVTVEAGVSIDTGGGQLQAQGRNIRFKEDGSVPAGTIETDGGSILMIAENPVAADDRVTGSGPNSDSGRLTIRKSISTDGGGAGMRARGTLTIATLDGSPLDLDFTDADDSGNFVQIDARDISLEADLRVGEGGLDLGRSGIPGLRDTQSMVIGESRDDLEIVSPGGGEIRLFGGDQDLNLRISNCASTPCDRSVNEDVDVILSGRSLTVDAGSTLEIDAIDEVLIDLDEGLAASGTLDLDARSRARIRAGRTLESTTNEDKLAELTPSDVSIAIADGQGSTITGEEVVLRAGDGRNGQRDSFGVDDDGNPDPDDPQLIRLAAEVDIFDGLVEGNTQTYKLVQDADYDDTGGQPVPTLNAGAELTLRSADGKLTLQDAATAGKIAGQDLILRAGEGDDETDPAIVIGPALGTITPADLELRVDETLRVDSDLVDQIAVEDGGTLRLHAGFGGEGVLVLDGSDPDEETRIKASRVIVQSGDGSSSLSDDDFENKNTSAAIEFDGDNVVFETDSLVWRQDSTIDADTITPVSPDPDIPGDPGVPFSTTLDYLSDGLVDGGDPDGDMALAFRSDDGAVEIATIAEQVSGTNRDLTLIGRTDVQTRPNENPFLVRTADVGGVDDFQVTQQIVDGFEFTDPDASRITLRAAFGRVGSLTFDQSQDDPVSISAAEIRLEATTDADGNGGGRVTVHTDDESKEPVFRGPLVGGEIQDTNPDVFVLHQDDDLTDRTIPESDFFGAGRFPMTLAVRSDFEPIDGSSLQSIEIEDLSILPGLDENDVPGEDRLLILSGPEVSVTAITERLDGEDGEDDPDPLEPIDLDFTALDGDVVILGDDIFLTAEREDARDGGDAPGIDASDNLYLEGYVSEDEFTLPSVDGGGNLTGSNGTSPISLVMEQEADWTLDELPTLDKFGSGDLADNGQTTGFADEALAVEYELATSRAGIDVSDGALLSRIEGANMTLNVKSNASGVSTATDEDGDPYARTVIWGPNAYTFEALNASAQQEMVLEEVALGGPISIVTDEQLRLKAGGNGREGMDLRLAGDVTLQGETVRLLAGNGGASSNATPETGPRVVATDADITFTFIGESNVSSETDTRLVFRQDANLTDDDLPDGGQITIDDGVLDELRVTSEEGTITLDALGRLAANSVTLTASSDGLAENSIISITNPLLSFDDIIDDPLLGDPDPEPEEFILQAQRVDLRRTGPGPMIVGGTALQLNGRAGVGSRPARIDLTQESTIFRPDFMVEAGQLGGALAGAKVRLFSASEDIVIEKELADRLLFTDLRLFANDHVVIDIDEDVRDHSLDLVSLVVTADQPFFEPKRPGDDDDVVIPDGDGVGRILLATEQTDRASGLAADEYSLSSIRTTGQQTYRSPVAIGANVRLKGTEVVFRDTVEAFGGDAVDFGRSLEVKVNERLRFANDVGVHSPFDRLEVILGQPPATALTEAGFADRSDLGDTLLELRKIPSYKLDPTDPNPERLTLRTDGNLVIRRKETDVPRTAIVEAEGDSLVDEFLFQSDNGKVVFGEQVRMAVDGSLRVESQGRGDPAAGVGPGKVVVADLAVAGTLALVAPEVHIRRRDGGRMVQSSGAEVRDSGTQIVANNLEIETNNLVLVDEGRDPLFGLPDPLDAPDSLRGADGTLVYPVAAINRSFAPIDGGDIRLKGTGVEVAGQEFGVFETFTLIKPEGPSAADLAADMYIIPPGTPQPMPVTFAALDEAALETIGIGLRELDPGELASQREGAAIIDDVRPPATPLRVASERLMADSTEAAALSYHRLFGERGDHAARIREVLQGALDDYRRDTRARRIVGFEFRRYVKNRPSGQFEAHQALLELDRLFHNHRNSGLSREEYRRIQARWLEAIKPEGITRDELSEAIHPSRYVRGSDILDIFGD
ncbi:MAG: filamentous hemagglutinin N-terminal domain-containing protein [Myxococcota bacterium]